MKRFIIYSILAIVGWALLATVATQTQAFRSWLRNRLVSEINDTINGAISVGKLSGNLLNRVQLDDVSLTLDGKPLAQIERVVLTYKPLALLSNRLIVPELIVQNPTLSLSQDDSLRWNVTRLLRAGAAPKPEAAGGAKWEIILAALRIENGTADIQQSRAAEFKLPRHVRDLNVHLGLSLAGNKLKGSLQQLTLRTEEPDFSVRTMKSDVNFDSTGLKATQVRVETDASRFDSNVDISDFRNPVLGLVLSGKPVSFAELRRLLPDLKLYGSPRLDIEAEGPLSDLRVKCGIRLEKGTMELAGEFDLSAAVPYGYSVNGTIAGLDLAEVTQDSTLASDLNLAFQLDGTGTNPDSLFAGLGIEVDSSSFNNTAFGPGTVRADMRADSLSFEMKTAFGSSRIALSGQTLLSRPNYRCAFDGNIRNLNLAEFMPESGMTSNLNLRLRGHGAGSNAENTSGRLDLSLLPSSLNNVPLDTAHVQISVADQSVNISAFEIDSPLGIVKAHGSMSMTRANALSLNADFTDFSFLTPVLPADSLHGEGTLSLSVTGPKDSLNLFGEISLSKAGMAGLALSRFSATGSGYITADGYAIDIDARAGKADAYGVAIDTLNVQLNAADTGLSFRIDAGTPGGVIARTSGNLLPQEAETRIRIDALEIASPEQFWQKTGETAEITLQGEQCRVDELRLESGEQTVALNGYVDLKGANRLRLALSRIDISRYADLLGGGMELGGLLDIQLGLDGTLAKPEVSGQIRLAQGHYAAVPFREFAGQLEFKDDYLTWHCNFAKDQGDSLLQSSGKLPLQLSLYPFESTLPRDQPLELKLSTRGIDMAFLQAFTTGVQDVGGLLVADIVLSNTLNDLRGIGPIRLVNGTFRIPELGTKYSKVNIVLVLKDKQVLMRDLQARSGDGYLKLLDGSLSLSEDGLDEFYTRLQVKDFELMHNKLIRARAKGIVELGGSVQDPYIIGDLTVDDARIYYESYEEETTVALTSQPFFVISADSTPFDTTGALRFQKSKEVQEELFTESTFYKNLTGELSFFFPRNVWIRSNDANIEIKGKVSAVKESDDFVLFGSFSTVRGFYELFGNRFQIQEGKLVFDGKPEMNPEIAIEATTIVTETQENGKPEQHEFTVTISGTLRFPDFKFSLDGEAASQEDVISILIFGQRFAKIRSGPAQTGGVSAQNDLESRATGLVTGQLIKQLSGKLGKGLSLDVIQIESGNQRKVKVGKYVTPDVFVTVSQDFEEQNSQVELEYEIPRKILFFNLLLQASRDKKGTTGLDVIWKMEW